MTTDPVADRLQRDPAALHAAMDDLGRAHFTGEGIGEAIARVETLVTEGLILSDLLGRSRIHDLIEDAQATFAADPAVAIPLLPFEEAVGTILSRHPALASTGAEVAQAYEAWGFAAARSIDIAVTERVQAIIAGFAARGEEVESAGQAISLMTQWSQGYSRTVYRTNLVTAFTAGEFQEMRKPSVSRFMGGFAVIGSNDADTRRGRKQDGGENHLATLGLVAATDDPVWRTHTPPFGYNCRHSLRPVSTAEARRKGWMNSEGRLVRQEPPQFRAFKPHANFIANTASSVYS